MWWISGRLQEEKSCNFFSFLESWWQECTLALNWLESIVNAKNSFSIGPPNDSGMKMPEAISSLNRSGPYRKGILMDIVIFKGDRFFKNGLFNITLFQKEQNRYACIPQKSNQRKQTIKNYVLNELKRYVKFNSNKRTF